MNFFLYPAWNISCKTCSFVLITFDCARFANNSNFFSSYLLNFALVCVIMAPYVIQSPLYLDISWTAVLTIYNTWHYVLWIIFTGGFCHLSLFPMSYSEEKDMGKTKKTLITKRGRWRPLFPKPGTGQLKSGTQLEKMLLLVQKINHFKNHLRSFYNSCLNWNLGYLVMLVQNLCTWFYVLLTTSASTTLHFCQI